MTIKLDITLNWEIITVEQNLNPSQGLKYYKSIEIV